MHILTGKSIFGRATIVTLSFLIFRHCSLQLSKQAIVIEEDRWIPMSLKTKSFLIGQFYLHWFSSQRFHLHWFSRSLTPAANLLADYADFRCSLWDHISSPWAKLWSYLQLIWAHLSGLQGLLAGCISSVPLCSLSYLGSQWSTIPLKKISIGSL